VLLSVGVLFAIPNHAAAPGAQGDVDVSLLLIGDAGAAAPEGDPVLQALSREIQRDAGRTVALFLGDNVYPEGLPPEGHTRRAESERRLLAQIEAGQSASRLIFVPGNHDWKLSGSPDDWEAVVRQGSFLSAHGPGRMFPEPGCPGPAVVDLGSHLRLVLIDTEWWLHGQPAPREELSCSAADAAGVVANIRTALEEAGTRHVVVVGHHPPVSAGPHGGHFGILDHLFPLRALKPWAWLPLPIVGSAYPIGRKMGVSTQDQSNERNQSMVAALRSAIEPSNPLLFAAGHEHQLAVFETGAIGTRYVAVSGAGIVDHERGKLGTVKGALFASKAPGFMRLDVMADGRVRLDVLGQASDGIHSRYSVWLK